MAHFLDLPAWDSESRLRVVVETPKGSAFKVRYDAETSAFTLQRALPGPLTYPHDWGFVSGTLADDGDPLDAMVIHDAATWPGLVIPSRPIAILEIRERRPGDANERKNPRIIAVPATLTEFDLSEEKKRSLTEFFQIVGQQKKQLRVVGWGDANDARAEIKRASERYAQSS